MSRIAAARRMSWGFGDQAVSSLINFAVGVLVARTVSPEEFGAFSVAFTTYTVALVTSRAMSSEPFMVRHSATGRDEWHAATKGSSGLALLVGVGAAVIVAALGLLVGGDLGIAFVALAVVLPGLLLQDQWRFAFIARGQSERAFALDLAWLALLVPGLLLVQLTGAESLAWPILVWGGTGGIAALGSHIVARSTPTFEAGAGWFRDHRDLGGRYAAEALISLGAIQLSTYALVAFSGLSAAGALRGGQLLLGPMQVLLMSLGLTGVPEGVRTMGRGGPRKLVRPAVVVSLSMAGATLLWGIFAANLPDRIGRAILGETWSAAQGLILPLALAYAAVCLGLGAGIGLRVLADARRSLPARTIDASAQATGGVVGAWAFGAVGAALGLALGGLVGAAAHWVLFLSSLRHRPPAGPPATVDSTEGGPVAWAPKQDSPGGRPIA